jgi:hypothetical protein
MQEIIVKSYRGDHAKANQLFMNDAVHMGAKGYTPVAQTYVPGTYSCMEFGLALLACLIVIGIIIFIYMIIVKPSGTLTVTYKLKDPIQTNIIG